MSLCFPNSTLVGQRIENGRTGRVMFSVTGDRLGAAYEVVNVQVTGEVPVGTYRNTAVSDYPLYCSIYLYCLLYCIVLSFMPLN